ncbi:MAG TPA: ferrochelatase [Thermoanaerobaculia bacterium]|nr:ferrochelatase [Thermoanaerobaculia bacterium]
MRPGVEPRRAVLLMAYGGPATLEEVEPFLRDVRGGRETSPELVAEVRARYRAIGGGSPILERTREQAAALEERLNRPVAAAEGKGHGEPGKWRVFVGMRHWRPLIREAVAEIAAGGFESLVALCLTPQESRMSVGAYFRALEEATSLEATADLPPSAAPSTLVRIRSWHDHPGFVAAVCEKVVAALARFPSAERPGVQVIYTAHSLPEAILREGDPYDRQVRETAAAVARAVEAATGLPLGRARARASTGPPLGRGGARTGGWHVAYQSAGARPEPWLGPSLDQVMTRLAGEGHRHLLAAPVGFVSDHVEVLYDLDVEARARARELGLRLERTESLNASPAFIDALADVVRKGAR